MLTAEAVNEMFAEAKDSLRSGVSLEKVVETLLLHGATGLLNSHEQFGRKLIFFGMWWGQEIPMEERPPIKKNVRKSYMHGWLLIMNTLGRQPVSADQAPIRRLVSAQIALTIGLSMHDQTQQGSMLEYSEAFARMVTGEFLRITQPSA